MLNYIKIIVIHYSLDLINLRIPRPGALGLLNFGFSDSFSGYNSSNRYFSLIMSSLSISNYK